MKLNRREVLSFGAAGLGTACLPVIAGASSVPKAEGGLARLAKPNYRENIITVLLENQRRHKPSLIPQMRALFTNTCLWNFVTIQVADADESHAYQIEYKQIDDGICKGQVLLSFTTTKIPIDKRMTEISDSIYMDRAVIGALRASVNAERSELSNNTHNTLRELSLSLEICTHHFANVIHRQTLRGCANRVITSPVIAALYGISSVFVPCEPKPERLGKAGTLGGRFDIYSDVLYPVNETLLLYNGEAPCDSGCVFMPYYLEDEYTLRYGITKPKSDYYAKLPTSIV